MSAPLELRELPRLLVPRGGFPRLGMFFPPPTPALHQAPSQPLPGSVFACVPGTGTYVADVTSGNHEGRAIKSLRLYFVIACMAQADGPNSAGRVLEERVDGGWNGGDTRIILDRSKVSTKAATMSLALLAHATVQGRGRCHERTNSMWYVI